MDKDNERLITKNLSMKLMKICIEESTNFPESLHNKTTSINLNAIVGLLASYMSSVVENEYIDEIFDCAHNLLDEYRVEHKKYAPRIKDIVKTFKKECDEIHTDFEFDQTIKKWKENG